MSVSSTATVCMLVSFAMSSESMAQSPQKPAPRVLELTPDKNGKDIQVRVGDEIVVKLPIQVPFTWGMTGQTTGLEEVKAPIKHKPIGKADKSDQVVGAPNTSALRYKIVAMPKNPTIEWVYCFQGRAIVNGVPIEPTEPLKPDQIPTKKGTYFRAKLVPLD